MSQTRTHRVSHSDGRVRDDKPKAGLNPYAQVVHQAVRGAIRDSGKRIPQVAGLSGVTEHTLRRSLEPGNTQPLSFNTLMLFLGDETILGDHRHRITEAICRECGYEPGAPAEQIYGDNTSVERQVMRAGAELGDVLRMLTEITGTVSEGGTDRTLTENLALLSEIDEAMSALGVVRASVADSIDSEQRARGLSTSLRPHEQKGQHR
ncbi:MAG: phage regulatory CII family protein [Planctomycetota bacterium]